MRTFILILCAGFFTAIALGVQLKQLPAPLFCYYLMLSLITFLWYAKDKRSAARGTWRTKESTLLLCALLGGWPGALLAQQLLRHKTQKQPFRLLLWLCTATNVAIALLLFTPLLGWLRNQGIC